MTTIRMATPGDAAAIAEIYVETWRAAYAGLLPDRALLRMSQYQHAAMWSRAISRRGRSEAVLVAELSDGEVVGFGSCGRSRGTGLPYAGEVFTLYVLHDHQGTGVGRGLLGGLFQRLLEAKLNSALVWVLARNPARFFYEAMGGRRIAERMENLWGAAVPETAYGWPDLERAVAVLEAH